MPNRHRIGIVGPLGIKWDNAKSNIE